jgi:hypothetical protein
MQLRDVVQSQILLKHIVLAITHAILASFSSKWAQNVWIFRGIMWATGCNQFMQLVFLFLKKPTTAIEKLVLIGPVWFS